MNQPYKKKNIQVIVTDLPRAFGEVQAASLKKLIEEEALEISGLNNGFSLDYHRGLSGDGKPTLVLNHFGFDPGFIFAEKEDKEVYRLFLYWGNKIVQSRDSISDGKAESSVNVMFYETSVDKRTVIDAWFAKNMTFTEFGGASFGKGLENEHDDGARYHVQFNCEAARGEFVHSYAQSLLNQKLAEECIIATQ